MKNLAIIFLTVLAMLTVLQSFGQHRKYKTVYNPHHNRRMDLVLNITTSGDTVFIGNDTIIITGGGGSSPAAVIEEADVIIIAGQSNAVGRADNTNLPAYLQGNQPSYIFNPSGFQVLNSNTHNNNQFNNKTDDFGSEMELAYQYNQMTGDSLYIIKYAVGGTRLYPDAGMDWSVSSTNEYYDSLLVYIDSALTWIRDEGKNPIIKAIVWHQGESDMNDGTYANGYEEQFTSLVNGLRTYLNTPELMFISAIPDPPYYYPYKTTVQQAIKAVASAISGVTVIDFTQEKFTYKADNIHLNYSDQIMFGKLILDFIIGRCVENPIRTIHSSADPSGEKYVPIFTDYNTIADNGLMFFRNNGSYMDNVLHIGGADLSPPLNYAFMNLTVNENHASGISMQNMATGSSNEFRFQVWDEMDEAYLAFNMPGTNNSGSWAGIDKSDMAMIFTTSYGTPRHLVLGTNTSTDFVAVTGGIQRLRILGTTGNVGIGIVSPSEKLHVVGNTEIEGERSDDNTHAELYKAGGICYNNLPADTWEQITGLSTGDYQDATVNDSSIIVNQAGTYMVNFAVTNKHSEDSTDMSFSVFKNRSAQSDLRQTHWNYSGEHYYNVSLTGIIQLSDSDTLDIRLNPGNTGTVCIEHLNFNISRFK